MNRVTAIILGLLLFGLGVFLGMVGSFYQSLLPEPGTTASRNEARTSRVAPAGQRAETLVKRNNLSANTVANAEPPQAIEAELSRALALLNSVLLSQTEPPPSPPLAAAADASTNALPAQPLQEFGSQFAATMGGSVAPAQPAAPDVTSPETPASAPPGHWVFDPEVGWTWMPENGSSVATAPMIEVYPGGWITIHSRTRPAGSAGTLMKKGAMRPSQMPKSGPIRR